MTDSKPFTILLKDQASVFFNKYYAEALKEIPGISKNKALNKLIVEFSELKEGAC